MKVKLIQNLRFFLLGKFIVIKFCNLTILAPYTTLDKIIACNG